MPETINPHGSANCGSCHTNAELPTKNNYNPISCDECHTRQDVNSKIHQLDNVDIHGSGISIPAEFSMDKTDEFSCLTCHAVVCKTDRANQTFLRGGPYQTELDFCYVCHESESYTHLNPHLQLHDDGALDESTCLHCHVGIPDQTNEKAAQTEMYLEMTPTCNKCHALHRHEEQHIDKELKTHLETLEAARIQYGISLPISVNNSIQCNTCHYTHQRNVLKKDAVVYNGSGDNAWRLRLDKERLCLACHDL